MSLCPILSRCTGLGVDGLASTQSGAMIGLPLGVVGVRGLAAPRGMPPIFRCGGRVARAALPGPGEADRSTVCGPSSRVTCAAPLAVAIARAMIAAQQELRISSPLGTGCECRTLGVTVCYQEGPNKILIGVPIGWHLVHYDCPIRRPRQQIPNGGSAGCTGFCSRGHKAPRLARAGWATLLCYMQNC